MKVSEHMRHSRRNQQNVVAVTGGIEWPFEHRVVAWWCNECQDYVSFGRAAPADLLELDVAEVIAEYAAGVDPFFTGPRDRKVGGSRDRWLTDRIDMLVESYLRLRAAKAKRTHVATVIAAALRGAA